MWNRGPLKILNGIKLILDDQFGIMQVLQRSPIAQTSNWSGTFFAFSYSKPALIAYCANIYTVLIDMIRAEWADDKSPWRCVNLE